MRNSIGDYFWAVLFASLGMVATFMVSNADYSSPLGTAYGLLTFIPMLFPGPLFGAALGKIMHSIPAGIVISIMAQFFILSVV